MKTATFEIRVFRKGNYIYIVPTDTGTEIEGLTKDVKIVRKSITSTEWAFYGFNSDFEIKDFEFPISLIKKENGDAYTNDEFKIFKDENTGGFASLNSTNANIDTPWHLFGSDPITIPAGTQRSVTIKAVNGDLEVAIGGVTQTYTDTYTFEALQLLNADIEIVSGEYQLIAMGQPIEI